MARWRAPGPGRAVTVSVVVVSYNSARDLPACLDSVAASTPTSAGSVEVVVVDNASSDGSADLVRSRYPGARVVDAGANLGFAAAVNRGVAHSSGELLVLLNPDAVLLPGSLEALVGFARDHPEHGLYGGRVVTEDGSNDPSSCWGAMTLWSLLCFATGLSTALPRHPLLDPETLGRWERDTVREVPVLTGCLVLAPRAVWDALGGLDEAYWLYGEDADLSLTAWQRGWRPVVVPEAEILHSKGGSSTTSAKTPLVLAGRATLLRRRWSPPARTAGLALLTAGVGLRAALARLTGRGGADWRRSWATRRLWLQGYPRARELASALPSPAPGAGGAAR